MRLLSEDKRGIIINQLKRKYKKVIIIILWLHFMQPRGVIIRRNDENSTNGEVAWPSPSRLDSV